MARLVIARLTASFADLAPPVASTMSDGVRTALLALLGLLVVIFGCLIAFAFIIRSRHGAAVVDKGHGARADRDRDSAAGEDDDDSAGAQPIDDPMVCPMCRREFASDLLFCPHDGEQLVPAPEMLSRRRSKIPYPSHGCPQCRRTFVEPINFCPHDGSEVVPVISPRTARRLGVRPVRDTGGGARGDTDAGTSAPDTTGDILEQLRQDPEARKHLHFGPELGYAPRGEFARADDGEIGKICPECRERYKYGATFCGKDGAELVGLN